MSALVGVEAGWILAYPGQPDHVAPDLCIVVRAPDYETQEHGLVIWLRDGEPDDLSPEGYIDTSDLPLEDYGVRRSAAVARLVGALADVRQFTLRGPSGEQLCPIR